MINLAFRGQIKKASGGFLLIPATRADYSNLNIYTVQTEGKYSTVTLKSGSGSKSYSQVKTAWALIDMVFRANKGRKPTENEKKILYKELLEKYSDKRQEIGILSSTPFLVPVSMSEMNKSQLSRFISSLIQLLHENTQGYLLSSDDLIEIGDLFEEWVNYQSCLDVDPTDLDENGNYLSLEEYRATHTVSYASGRTCGEDGSPLEMAHIVSKGSDPAFENCCWNVMMLTHEEHQGIMHGQEIVEGGWNALAARFPHITGRIRRAYNLSKHLYKIMEEEGIEL